jgi:hypothetical protein
MMDFGWMVNAATLLGYIGPGADVGLISSVIGLLLTLGASTTFLVLMPFRAAIRRLRGKSAQAAKSQEFDAEAGT